ncbi:PA14 domain-containing protein [uncultured Roseobacter sp.]|uniref:PA14 domain-containing protein n=1 Tax=uncultured Roseobacter sp. TaxID=114847 RepID=UPI002603FBD2|nr:PA14 domain-containing protein [uncultured Roseobacter sp.]
MADDDENRLDDSIFLEQHDTASDKEKVVVQSLKGNDAGQEDQSRSALHYGEQEQAEASARAADTSYSPSDTGQPAGAFSAGNLPGNEDVSASGGNEDGAGAAPSGAPGDDAGVVADLSDFAQEAGGIDRLSVSDVRFEIRDFGLTVKSDAVFSDEEAADLNVEVSAVGPDGTALTRSFDVDVPQINPAPTGLSVSNLGIATGEDGAVVAVINLEGTGDYSDYTFSVSDDRFEVSGREIRLREGIALSDDETGSLDLQVTATSPSGAELVQDVGFEIIDTPAFSGSGGFRASYFDVDHRLSRLDDIDWNAPPTHEEVVSDINYTNSRESFWEGGDKDTFGARITGNVEVSEGGEFSFFLGGDDGVVLLINGEEVVSDDSLHGYRTRSGTMELEPGTHHVEVRYFENYGHAGLKLEWEGPGTDGRELLTAPGFDDLQTINGMPLTIALEVTDEGQDGSVSVHVIDGLPEGTAVSAGDAVLTAGPEGQVDVTGLDLSLLTVSTPVEFTGQVNAQLVTTTTSETGISASSSMNIAFDVQQADLPLPDNDMTTGFRASYFDVNHRLSRLDQIDWSSEPTHEEVVQEINYTNSRESFWEGGDKDTFGARITGEIDVDEGGSFKFFLGGDDGVVLFINGEEVVTDDGLHGYRTRSGEIELEPGTHEVEVRYFENYGHAGLKLEWEGPGIEGRELVTASDELSVDQNGMIAVELDDPGLSDQAHVVISGLPEDTILMSGDMVAVSDGGEVDLAGWDLSLLEIAPPPGFEGRIEGEVTTTDTAFNGQQVTGTSTFALDVGDVENGGSPASGFADDAWVAGGDDSGQTSWVETADNEQAAEANDDNALNEEIADNPDAGQNYEMNDTYERNDW